MLMVGLDGAACVTSSTPRTPVFSATPSLLRSVVASPAIGKHAAYHVQPSKNPAAFSTCFISYLVPCSFQSMEFRVVLCALAVLEPRAGDRIGVRGCIERWIEAEVRAGRAVEDIIDTRHVVARAAARIAVRH